jgi:sugar lactone lactonase YvrE
LDQLVITTGWEELSDEQRAAEPWAGHLLITQAPVRGLEPFRFMADAR